MSPKNKQTNKQTKNKKTPAPPRVSILVNCINIMKSPKE